MTAAPFAADAAALDLVLRATVLIGAAWAGAASLRRMGASAAGRHMAWLFGIAALLALPIVWWLAPPLRLPILAPEAMSAAPTLSAAPGAVAQPATEWSPYYLLLGLYLIGVAALLLRFAMSHYLVAQLWRAAEPVRSADWQDLLSRLAGEIGIGRPITLRIARGPAMAMTWGTLAPKVLLPAEALTWSPDRRRLVLLHELAHVARRDSLSRSAASLACALYWFHPGAWFAARRMRLEQEYAADDRVLVSGAPARGYALSLLDLARRSGETSRPGHAAAMAGACQLERRVLAITTPARRDEPGPSFLAAAAVAGTFVMLVAAAGLPVRPLSEPLDAPSIEPVASTAGSMPAADEGRASGPEAAFPREDARPQDSRGGGEAQRVAAPAAPMPAQSRPAEATHIGSPMPAQAAQRGDLGGQDRTNIVPPIPQREIYGPRLPSRLAAEQALDPRIPEPLRSRNPRPPPQDDNAAGRTTGHRIVRGVLRVLPSLLMASSDSMP